MIERVDIMERSVILEVKGVSKRFGDLKALDCINLKVFEGEILAIIGPNGAGKTTLIDVITGELKPDSGKILLGRDDITFLPPYILVKKGLARSFQITNLFNGLSVKENILLAIIGSQGKYLKIRSDKDFVDNVNFECEKLINELGITDFKNEIVDNLPYGVQRILEVGLCIAIRPKIIFLDEFVAGLTVNERVKVGEFIKNLVKNRKITSVIIEHDLDTVFSISDRIIVMHEGRIIADGSPRQIKDNKLVKMIYLGY